MVEREHKGRAGDHKGRPYARVSRAMGRRSPVGDGLVPSRADPAAVAGDHKGRPYGDPLPGGVWGD